MIVNGSFGRRALLIFAAASIAWAIVVLVTGGFVIETRWRTFSSRAAIRPLIGAGLLLLYYLLNQRQHWRTDIGPLARIELPYAFVSAAAAVTLVVALGWGARIAGGPDASGYVSEAALFARGQLTMRAPAWSDDARWNNATLSAAPVGYAPTSDSHRLAPTYSPGLPLVMALFQIAAGPGAVFFVVPIFAVVALWATFRLGETLHGRWAGAIAAVLIASSPAFLSMSVQAMSDVPVTACWTIALVAASRGRAVTAGIATAMAILIRPNLVPLGTFPASLLFVAADVPVRRTLLFLLAAAPAPLIVGGLNWHYYGSPLRSGYGPLDYLYALERVLPNLRQYSTWFVRSQTAVPLVGLLAPFAGPARLRLALVCCAFPAAVLAMYLPYFTFQPYEWGYLRFLLPGFPPLMVGLGVVIVSLAKRTPRREAAAVVAALVVGFVAVYAWRYAIDNGVFRFQQADQRYARAVAHARQLPEKAVMVSLAHSGTLHLYTGRDVLRFEAIGREDIDAAVSHIEARGHTLYLIGDPFEIEMFRERFTGTNAAARLERATSYDVGGVMVYGLTRSP